MTNIDYLVQHFDNLINAQGASMAAQIQWAIGGGWLIITKTEWARQDTLEAKRALVSTRQQTLYERIQREANAKH